MKKRIELLLIAILLVTGCTNSPEQTVELKERTIQVTGSAEKEIAPDIIYFAIEIEEYWKEEFQSGKKFKDYKTKVDIAVIEKELYQVLDQLGIKKDVITLEHVGNYWRYHGKEFLISKRLKLKLDNVDMIDKIISEIDMKGIESMRIQNLKHTELTEHRKEVKKEALKAAKEKAKYLLESAGKKLGDVVRIKELNNDWQNNYYRWYSRSASMSNAVMPGSGNDSPVRSIKLRFEIEVEFEIN